MKNLSLRIKFVLIAVLSLFAFSGVLLGASNIAKADTTVEARGTMEIAGSSLYLTDEEAEEGVDVNGIRFAFWVSTATYQTIAGEEYEAGVYVCPNSLLPSGYASTDPSSFGEPFVKATFAVSAWSNYNDGKVAYVVLYDIPSDLYDEEFTVIGYYYDGTNFHLTTDKTRSMSQAAGAYIAENRATADATWEAVMAKYATMYNVKFLDENKDEVVSGSVSSAEQPINLLSTADQQKGWVSDSGVNGRAFITEDTTFNYTSAYCSYDAEGGEWYDTLGVTISLGSAASNKSVIVTFDMLVETDCTDFALLELTNGVTLLNTALDPADYATLTSYSITTTANANGEIILAVGDWHSYPQEVVLYIENVEYEIANLASRSVNTNNGYSADFVIIPTELPVGTYVSGSVKLMIDKYTDAYVSTAVKTINSLWGDNSLNVTTQVVAYADITGAWQTVEFETTVMNYATLKQDGSSSAVDLSGNYVALAVTGSKNICNLTVYKEASLTKLYATGNSSIQTKDGYGQYFAAIPVDSDIADVGEEVDVEIDIMIDTYSDQYVTPVLYKVDSIANSQVSTKTQVLAAASITDDTWQTVTFRATVLNAASIAAYGTNGSTATFSGNYVLLVYTTTKNTTNLIKFKDPTSMTKFVKDWEDAARSYQSSDKYGGDVIFIPVEGAGNWAVSMSIKTTPYVDNYVSNAIKYVSTVWGDNSLNSTTTIVANADITGDWQDIEFTAPAVNFSSLKITSTSSAVTAPSGYYVAVVIERIKINLVDVAGYKNVKVTVAPAQAARSYQSNDKYGSDFILIGVESEGNYTVTLDVKADKYYDQWFKGEIAYVTTVYGDNAVNACTTVVANADMVDDAWNNDITFTAPAINATSIKHSGSANAITAPSTWYIAVRVKIKSGVSALTEYRNVEVEKAPEQAVRSYQSNQYGSDYIFIPVSAAGNYTVTLDIKADKYYDQWYSGRIAYVTSEYSDYAVNACTVVVAHENMVDDAWNNGITFTAPAVNFTSVKDTASSNALTPPSTWYVLVRVYVKNGVSAITEYKNVEVVGNAQRSYKSNGYGADLVLLSVDAAGSYDVTMKVKIPTYLDAYVKNALSYVTTVWADNSINATTAILSHGDITGDWQEISFTATAVNFTGIKNDGQSNEISAPSTYYIALVNGTTKTTSTSAMQFKDIVITAAS